MIFSSPKKCYEDFSSPKNSFLLFIPWIKLTTHFGTKSLGYSGPLIWNIFSRNINDNKFHNVRF